MIAVGPSAPPMMPMAAATLTGKWKISRAPRKAEKIPNCAAAPSSREDGRAISGPKSVIAPTPIKISGG